MSGAEIEAAPDLAQKLTKTLPRSRRIWFPFLLLLHGFYTNFAKKLIEKFLNFSRPAWRFMKSGCVYFASPWGSYSWDFCQKAMLQCGRNNWRSKSCGRSRWLLSYLESLSSFQHYLEFVKMRNSRANGTFRHFKPASILGCSRCDSCGGSGGVRPQ